MSQWISGLTMAVSVAFTGVLIEWIARPREPERMFFGHLGRKRTAADDARIRRLRVGNAVVTLLGVIAVLSPIGEGVKVLAVTIAPLVSALWLCVEAMLAARTMKLEKIPGRFVVTLDGAPRFFDIVSLPLQLANVLCLVVPSAVFAWVLGRLPPVVPAHWNAAGEIDRWADPRELWMMAGVLAFDVLLLVGMSAAMTKERWALPEEGAERYAELQLARRRNMVRLVEWIMLGVNFGTAAIWMGIALGSLPGLGWLLMPTIGVAIVAMLGGTFAPMVFYVPRLSKVQDELRSIAGTEALGTHPSGWRWHGMIYYAPEDPAVFVPKRIGIGQTLNFARPGSWLFLSAVVVLPLIITAVAIAFAD